MLIEGIISATATRTISKDKGIVEMLHARRRTAGTLAVLATLMIVGEVGLCVEVHDVLDPPVSTGIISTLSMATVFGFIGYATEGSWRAVRMGVAVAIVLGGLMAALLGFGMRTELSALTGSWDKNSVGGEQSRGFRGVRLAQSPWTTDTESRDRSDRAKAKFQTRPLPSV